VKLGTSSSLVIIDELGRGTSTFDGVSISNAVMKYLIKDLKCLVFFATHYHTLVYESLEFNEVGYFKMDYKYDKESEKLQFLYKLVTGVAEKSFGIDVAKIARVPQVVLNVADDLAKRFEDKISKVLVKNVDRDFTRMLNDMF